MTITLAVLRHTKPWLHHAALNAGVALWHLRRAAEAVWYGVLPPQWTHAQDEVDDLRSGSMAGWFVRGLEDEE